MTSILEQFKDLFVFVYCKNSGLSLALPIFGLGEKKNDKKPEGRPVSVANCGLPWAYAFAITTQNFGGAVYDKY